MYVLYICIGIYFGKIQIHFQEYVILQILLTKPQCTKFSKANDHIHVFRPSQDSSVWLGLTSREQLMSYI